VRDTIKSRREKQGGARLAISNMVRRGIVKAASAVTRWQAEGFEGEIFDAVEVFQQVGFASRPRSSAAAQLIMLALQGSARAVVGIASRSTDGRPEMAEDETAIHNSTGYVKLTEDGDIVVRCKPGQKVFVDDGSGAVALATLADVQTLRDYVATQFLAAGGHTHAVSGSITTTITAIAPTVSPPAPPTNPVAPTMPAGTTVLNGK
jgi:phage gp45-like